MDILTCYQTLNRCYKSKKKAAHVGILVHSTGAVNRNLYRYVDSVERLGKNRYNNHWNKEAADKCMHAFIGYDKNGEVIVANTLPYEYACWGCGKGSKGSYNYNPVAHIQFEICQGSSTDADYYWKAIGVAEEYCAYLCQKFEWDADAICSHREAARSGWASNHGDPDSWMKHFGDDMGKFRARVAERLGEGLGSVGTADGGSDVPKRLNADAMPQIQNGNRGTAVEVLQTALLAFSYPLPKYGADGAFGAETEKALKAFQKAHGLAADGVCGATTWAAVDAEIEKLKAAVEETSGADASSGDTPAVVDEAVGSEPSGDGDGKDEATEGAGNEAAGGGDGKDETTQGTTNEPSGVGDTVLPPIQISDEEKLRVLWAWYSAERSVKGDG